jgi:hypothetical protein
MSMTEATPTRRNMFSGLKTAALASAVATAAIASPGAAQTPVTPKKSRPGLTDIDILNFALNLEYLEAEFYLNATTGRALESATAGAAAGSVSGGRQAQISAPLVQMFARNVAKNEYAHVNFLQSALGANAAPRPTIDLRAGFSAVGQAAGLGANFDPFADDLSFLLGAFLFEDVGVTAYKGAAPLISNRDYLKSAAGIHATEAYHAGCARTLLYRSGPQGRAGANKISALRDQLDGPGTLDQGIEVDGRVNIVPCDSGGICFGRTPEQVLNIVYGTPGSGISRGGFFPDGTTGKIQMT